MRSNARRRRAIVWTHRAGKRLGLPCLLVLLPLLFSPLLTHANPLPGPSYQEIRATVSVVEFGVPYRKPYMLTVSCAEPAPMRPESMSTICWSYECPMGGREGRIWWFYSGGPCDLTIQTVDGQSVTFDAFMARVPISFRDPSEVLEVDIGTREMRAMGDLTERFQSPRLHELLGSFRVSLWAALSLTIVVETLTLLIMTRYCLKLAHLRLKTVVVAGVLPSLVTLPCMWFFLMQAVRYEWGLSYTLLIVIAEALVTVSEAAAYLWLLRVTPKSALLLSLIANISSFLVGSLIL